MANDEKKPTAGIIGTGRSAVEFAVGLMGHTAGDSAVAAAADLVRTPPTLTDAHGRAWKLDMAAMRAMHHVPDEADGTVSCWLVEAPWAHPIWHSYELVLVHLRGTPSLPAPIKHRANATHELWVIALDPAKPRQPRLDGAKTGAWLYPLNFAAQIVEVTDELAAARVEAAVREVIAGKLSPDTDHMRAWVQRFGDNMLKR